MLYSDAFLNLQYIIRSVMYSADCYNIPDSLNFIILNFNRFPEVDGKRFIQLRHVPVNVIFIIERNSMNEIFTYTDYRKLLADFYDEHKKNNANFSYQVFALKAGFSNKGFLYNVISGTKNLSKSSAMKLSQAMKLSPVEAEYFEILVSLNQAKNLSERNYFFEKLSSIKSAQAGSAQVRELRKEQYEFYSKWYLSAIRSLIDMHPFKDDYVWLAKNIYPQIKPLEAKKAVKLLEKLGLIKKGNDDFYKITERTITASKEIVQLGILNFHKQTAGLALNAIEEMTKEKRNVSGLTLGISQETYYKMCTEIEKFQSKLQSIAEKDSGADNVYQLNFQFFPISNVNGIVTGRQGWRSDCQQKEKR